MSRSSTPEPFMAASSLGSALDALSNCTGRGWSAPQKKGGEVGKCPTTKKATDSKYKKLFDSTWLSVREILYWKMMFFQIDFRIAEFSRFFSLPVSLGSQSFICRTRLIKIVLDLEIFPLVSGRRFLKMLCKTTDHQMEDGLSKWC